MGKTFPLIELRSYTGEMRENIPSATMPTEDRYTLISNVVEGDLLDAARDEIRQLIARNPPPTGHKGYHFYFLNDIPAPLFRLLTGSPALRPAASLVALNELAHPDQVQVSLIVLPWTHRPGGPTY